MTSACEVLREFTKIPRFMWWLWRQQGTARDALDVDRPVEAAGVLRMHGEPFGVTSDGWSEIIENEWQFDRSIASLGLTPLCLPNSGLPGDQPPADLHYSATGDEPDASPDTVHEKFVEASAHLEHEDENRALPTPHTEDNSTQIGASNVHEFLSAPQLRTENRYPGIFDETRGQSPDPNPSYSQLSPLRDSASVDLRAQDGHPFTTTWPTSSTEERLRREAHTRAHMQKQVRDSREERHAAQKRVTFASDSLLGVVAPANTSMSLSAPEMTSPCLPKRRRRAQVTFFEDVLEHVITMDGPADVTWYDTTDYARFQRETLELKQIVNRRLRDVSSDDAITFNGRTVKLFK